MDKADRTRRVLYDDANVTVVQNRTLESDTMVVAFGDMLGLAKGDAAWGEPPVQRAGFDLLSIMSKNRDWFPVKSMQPVLSCLRPILDQYDERICYGGSMGGYAALKYSRALKADSVLAFVPQFSIDPGVLGDWRYNKYFLPDLHEDMAITAQDVSGHVLMISDPGCSEDEAHMRLLMQALPNATRLGVRSIEHHATGILAGTSFFTSSIEYLRGRLTLTELATQARQMKRRRPLFYRALARKLLERHPTILAQALDMMAERGDPSSPFEMVVIQELVRVRERASLPGILEDALRRYQAAA